MNTQSIVQGNKVNQNRQNRVNEQFSTAHKREGFTGILGKNSEMDGVLASDMAKTNTNVANIDSNITTYGKDYTALKEKTELYINNPNNTSDMKKNYNIFVNKSLKQTAITETNHLGCVKSKALSNLTLYNSFNEYYWKPFASYEAANDACKLWAADTGSTVYALRQDRGGNYQCYIGNKISDSLERYVKPKNLYTVMDGEGTAYYGGLFPNGQVGTFNGNTPNPIKGANTVPVGYEFCDPFSGGKMNDSTIKASYGRPCSTLAMPPATDCNSAWCSIEGQTCLSGTQGAGNTNWMCKDNMWNVSPLQDKRYQLQNVESKKCLITGPGGTDVYDCNIFSNNDKEGSMGDYSFMPTGEANTYAIQSGVDVCIASDKDGNLRISQDTKCSKNAATDLQKLELIPVPYRSANDGTRVFQIKNKSTNQIIYSNSDGRFGSTDPNWGYSDQLWTLRPNKADGGVPDPDPPPRCIIC
jgi:hypothetical protein